MAEKPKQSGLAGKINNLFFNDIRGKWAIAGISLIIGFGTVGILSGVTRCVAQRDYSLRQAYYSALVRCGDANKDGYISPKEKSDFKKGLSDRYNLTFTEEEFLPLYENGKRISPKEYQALLEEYRTACSKR